MTDPPRRARPTVVTTLAIIGIVEGILWLLCGGFGLLSNAASLAAGHSIFGPAYNEPRAMLIVGAAETLVWVILAIVLVWACAAALSLKPWARRVLIPWSVIAILYFIVQFAVQAAWIGPHGMQAMKDAQGGQPPASMSRPILTCVGVAMLIALCALPICFLTMWRSEVVIAAFESQARGE